MDQSNGQFTNDQLCRMTALQLAISAHARENGWPDDIIVQARQFYLFLAEKDPCVDLGLDEVLNEDGERKVIRLEEYAIE